MLKKNNLIVAALILGALIGLTGWGSGAARAEYPDHMINVVSPFPPGSAVDIVSRLLATHLGQQTDQRVLVLNKPGADAIVGFDYVAKAKPDGYTILVSAGAETRMPAMHSTLPFDPVRDIIPVATLGDSNYLMGVTAKRGFNSLADLLAFAKANPGKLNAAVSGNADRLAVYQMMLQTGIKMEVVSYAGTAEIATALLSGEADLALMGGLAFKPVLDSKGVKLLATVSAARNPSFPDIPTTAEAGLPNFDTGISYGVYTTAGTPPEIVQKLNAEIKQALATPDFAAALTPYGLSLPKGSNDPSSLETSYSSAIAFFRNIVKQAGIPTSN